MKITDPQLEVLGIAVTQPKVESRWFRVRQNQTLKALVRKGLVRIEKTTGPYDLVIATPLGREIYSEAMK